MLVLLSLCLFFFYFCDPCALLPDVPEIALNMFEVYYPNLLTYFVLLVLMCFLLNVSGDFIAKVRYIPYNISLNMLIQRTKKSTRHTVLQYFYPTLIATLLSEEVASAVVFLENSLLDEKLFHFLASVIAFNISMLKAAYRYTLFCNSELSAFWRLILILQRSSDFHPNPG